MRILLCRNRVGTVIPVFDLDALSTANYASVGEALACTRRIFQTLTELINASQESGAKTPEAIFRYLKYDVSSYDFRLPVCTRKAEASLASNMLEMIRHLKRLQDASGYVELLLSDVQTRDQVGPYPPAERPQVIPQRWE